QLVGYPAVAAVHAGRLVACASTLNHMDLGDGAGVVGAGHRPPVRRHPAGGQARPAGPARGAGDPARPAPEGGGCAGLGVAETAYLGGVSWPPCAATMTSRRRWINSMERLIDFVTAS